MTSLRQRHGELARFAVASEPGNERLALARVAEALENAGLSAGQLERLKTAVAEATMNGIEHGNDNRPELPVELTVAREPVGIVVTVTDLGGAKLRAGAASGSDGPEETPDLAAKLAGLQRPRGWGLFLIRSMVDDVDDSTEGDRHIVRLVVRLAGGGGAGGGAAVAPPQRDDEEAGDGPQC